MAKSSITFVIFTYNEEARIERAVRNFIKAGPVLVVDNCSTDRTVALATEAGARVLAHKNPGWVEDEDTVLKVKSAVNTPWIYWGYSDEMVDRGTLDAILAAVSDPRYSIVSINRKNYFYGRFCHSAYASPLNRLFKPDAIDFRGNVIHRFGKPKVAASEIKVLDPERYFVHHFISNNAKSYLRTLDGYTDIEAGRVPRKTVSRFIVRSALTFISNYAIRRGYKAGIPGLFLCLQMSYYDALLTMKSYELHEKLDTAGIEARNNLVRDKILLTLNDEPTS